MSIKVMSWVWDYSRSCKNARLVLLAIADCANDEGRHAYPSMPTLERKTGLRERAISQIVSQLETLGELEVSRNGGPKGCNLYRVVMDAPKERSDPAGNNTPPAFPAGGTKCGGQNGQSPGHPENGSRKHTPAGNAGGGAGNDRRPRISCTRNRHRTVS